MSFMSNFFHHPPSHPEYQGPPQPPPPWIAEWDGQSQRWFFVNQQTGEREWNFPQAGPPQGYNQAGQGYGQGSGGAPQESHTGRNTAIAAVAGLAGGALLMHEGEKVEDDWRRDKDRLEDRVDYDKDRVEGDLYNAGQDVENFPDNAARWTGRKVGEVEDIPQDIENDYDRAKYGVENKFDNAVQDVEDLPDEAANWSGRKLGEAERFDDGIQDSFDEGRDEERYDNNDDY